MNGTPELLYEDTPPSAAGLVAAVVAFLIIGDLLLGFFIPEILGIMAVTAVFEAALFYFIVPRKYQVMSDRLRIRLGGPIKMDMPFSTIKEARPGKGTEAWVYWGLRLATSSRGVVEIIRRGGGLDAVISPRDRETFLEQLNLAMAAAGGGLKTTTIRLN
ncbi:PH domain-containing protein [Dehalogenimonas sp. 4OHTPN]|uniref:PH domain-containing protein n=1 Tax=Dehalogenimonas sp. 4OHTPN TaxID=3166643 RepID=A0AAU8GCS5_9CHLR